MTSNFVPQGTRVRTGMSLDVGWASSAGVKAVNEDFCAAMLPQAGLEAFGAIAAVADGVSTGGGGREAAQTTAATVVRDYFGTRATWDTTAALDRLISAQNAWLVSNNRRRGALAPEGHEATSAAAPARGAPAPLLGLTTLTTLVLRGCSYTVGHVGDTRAYLVRSEGAEARVATQLTQDHVVDHPDMRHQLLRVVGAQDHLVVDYVQGEMREGDVFVLLSDGVHGSLPPRKWLPFLAAGHAQAAADEMVQTALRAGSPDNASAIVVRVCSTGSKSWPDFLGEAKERASPARLRVGDAIDGMTVRALLADNGLRQVVHVAWGEGAHEQAVLKCLHPSRARDPHERGMLAHEAWLMQQLAQSSSAQSAQHWVAPAPPPQEPSQLYCLSAWHEGKPLLPAAASLPDALRWAIQTLAALGGLHRANVVHRDIKPSNLLWCADGVLRVLDLGAATSGLESADAKLLHVGSPSYMNPEQFGYVLGGAAVEPQAANAQSDLYALGVCLYQWLTGRLPYGEVLPYQIGRYHRDPTRASRLNPEVPMWLDHIVMKAVSRNTAERFETAEEFALALERGAVRPLLAPSATPLSQGDPLILWRAAFAVSALFNLALLYWLLFLPR